MGEGTIMVVRWGRCWDAASISLAWAAFIACKPASVKMEVGPRRGCAGLAHHAGLREHMLVCLQRCHHKGVVEVWPCADHDGVYGGVVYDVSPVVCGLQVNCWELNDAGSSPATKGRASHPLNAKFLGNLLRRVSAAICDRDNGDSIDCGQFGDMVQLGVSSST